MSSSTGGEIGHAYNRARFIDEDVLGWSVLIFGALFIIFGIFAILAKLGEILYGTTKSVIERFYWSSRESNIRMKLCGEARVDKESEKVVVNEFFGRVKKSWCVDWRLLNRIYKILENGVVGNESGKMVEIDVEQRVKLIRGLNKAVKLADERNNKYGFAEYRFPEGEDFKKVVDGILNGKLFVFRRITDSSYIIVPKEEEEKGKDAACGSQPISEENCSVVCSQQVVANSN